MRKNSWANSEKSSYLGDDRTNAGEILGPPGKTGRSNNAFENNVTWKLKRHNSKNLDFLYRLLSVKKMSISLF